MYCFLHALEVPPDVIACPVDGHDLVDQDPATTYSGRRPINPRMELAMAADLAATRGGTRAMTGPTVRALLGTSGRAWGPATGDDDAA